ncbi:hypothetical protein M514_14105 [Trichuris suis]|uniref:Reverse transcriptase domain-containing protein n=1 Tax=Trichuris suis TaxID=68888 RepID=A0A085MXQ2_9BILA|nr:hypothetical protein M514_14105 [Trichuris suis]
MVSYDVKDLGHTFTSICAFFFSIGTGRASQLSCDATPLQLSRRSLLTLPNVEEELALLVGAALLSKLDASAGFWQIALSDKSSRLTTFITPFGRFCFKRLPFGISSAPEYFQSRMNDILAGLPGAAWVKIPIGRNPE